MNVFKRMFGTRAQYLIYLLTEKKLNKKVQDLVFNL